MMIVRELCGGIYFGTPRSRERVADGSERAVNTCIYTHTTKYSALHDLHSSLLAGGRVAFARSTSRMF